MNNSHNAFRNIASFRNTGKSQPISGIELMIDEKNMYFAGNDDGYVMTIDCPYGTQEMANDLLAKAQGFEYQGFTAEQVILPPETELGDGVTVAGIYGMVARRSFKFTPGMTSSIEAPRELEVQHEYKYSSPQQRKTERQIAETRSLITKTSEEITLEIQGVDGRVSSLQLTLDGVTVTGSDGVTRINGGMIQANSVTAAQIDATNLQVAAANITGTLTVGWSNVSGKPSFSSVATSGSYNDLSNKPSIPTDYDITTIIGNTVTTGFVDALGVSAVELIGNSIYLRDDENARAATLHLTGDRSSWDMRELEIESGNVYITSNADFVVITGGSGGRLTFSNSVVAESDFICSPAGGHDLGYSSSSSYWRDLFIENAPTVVSDRNKKKDINYDLADVDGFFDDLKPAAFRFINGSSGRRHFGMIAQDVEENLAAHGIDPIDFAGFCKDTTEDDDGQDPEKGDGYALRYGEFISLCIDQIQRLKKRVKALEGIA